MMQIRIHPSFWLYLGSIAFLSSPMQCLSACTALLVHEFSHCAVTFALGERFSRMDITPFGGVMIYESGKSSSKGLKGAAVAAAGPLGNYLFILLLSTVGSRYPDVLPKFISSSITANAAMLILNLLPALPLDGGRIVFCFGYYLCSVSRLASILSALGAILGVFFVCFGLYAAAETGILNVSLLFVGVYLAVHAMCSRSALLSENLYAVVQERLERKCRTVPLKLYRVLPDTPIHALITPIVNTDSAAFVIEGDNQIIGEQAILKQLLKNPAAHITELN